MAERELFIAPVLKPSEMANADHLGLLAYLTQFYDVLHDREVVGKPPEKKAMQKNASKSDSQLLDKGTASSGGVVLRPAKEKKVCCCGEGGGCCGERTCYCGACLVVVRPPYSLPVRGSVWPVVTFASSVTSGCT